MRVKLVQWRRLHRAAQAMREALAGLDWDAGVDVETGGDGEFAYDNDRGDPTLDIHSLHDLTQEAERVTHWLLAKRKRQPGRPRTMDTLQLQFFLVRPVAMSLDAAGVKLTKGRDGVLAQTLTVVLDAVGYRVPEDLFPLVRRAVEGVRRVRERPAANTAAVPSGVKSLPRP